MAGLRVMNGSLSGQFIELNAEESLIGRLPRCTLVLDAQGVSREHAKIRREGDRFCVQDLNSRNTTKLNDQVLPPMQDCPLKEGDRISICDVEFVFHNQWPPPPEEKSSSPIVITESGSDATLHTLDASRSDQIVCAVKPETKLRAILEISRNLSTNLRLETVAPKILESLVEVFPQAERTFVALIRADDPKRTIRQTFHKIRESKKSGIRSILARASCR